MKKLIAMLCAIATGFFAFGETTTWSSVTDDIAAMTAEVDSTTNIVGYAYPGTANAKFIVDLQTTEEKNLVHWWTDDTSVLDPVNFDSPVTVKEDEADENAKYLAIETGAEYPLLRTLSPVKEKDDQVGAYVYAPVDIENHGLFVDTQVKFTPSAEAPTPADDTKIMVWALEIEADTEQDIAAATNLMVTCGIDEEGVIVPATYTLKENIDASAFYRLTIRSDVKGLSSVFRIFLDEVELTVQDVEFLSLKNNKTLAKVGYAGSGAVKTVDLFNSTDAASNLPFAADPTYLKITWNEGVIGFVVNDGAPIMVTGEGETNLLVAAGETTIAPIYQQTPEYKLKEFTATEELALDVISGVATVTVPLYADASTLNIAAKLAREGAQLWIRGEQVGENFPFTKDVVDYVVAQGLTDSAVTIKLLMNEEGSDFGDFSQLEDATLDLNGCSLTAKDWAPAWDTFGFGGIVMVGTGHELTIVDTSVSGGGSIVGVYDAEVPANNILPIYNTGSVYIEAAEGANPIKFIGKIYNAYVDEGESYMFIKGGKFSEPLEVVEDCVEIPEGYEWTEEPDAEGFYTITLPGALILTLVDDDTNATLASVPAATAPIAKNTEVTVTATPNEGYEYATLPAGWTEGTVEGTIVSNFTITADTTVTAPAPTQIEYTLTLTAGDNTTLTAAPQKDTYHYNDVVVITATPATGYEFATLPEGWFAAENGAATNTVTITDNTTIEGPAAVQSKTGFAIIIAGDETTTTNYYPTLDAAIAAAGTGEPALPGVVTLLEDATLTETLTIAKAVTLDLNDTTLTLGENLTAGIKITADGVEIKNGEIASSLTANALKSKAIEVAYANVTLTDVEIDAAHYEYAIYANCDEACTVAGESENEQLAWFYTQETFKTLTCDGVAISGNGSLFHVEGMVATLKDCSAIADENELFANAAHRAAVYSSLNARTTIMGSGTYTHEKALLSGNLGGKITVVTASTAEFTGEIYSWMQADAHDDLEQYADYKATYVLDGGSYNCTVAFKEDGARALDSFMKNAQIEIPAPEGYIWYNDITLGKPIVATFMVDEDVYAAETNIVAFTPATPTAPTKEGYTFTGWDPEIAKISADQIYTAQFSEDTVLVTFTVADITGATLVSVTTNGEAVVAGDAGYTVEAGASVTLTFTAAEGYKTLDPATFTTTVTTETTEIDAGETIKPAKMGFAIIIAGEPVTTNYYATLAEAFGAVADGGTVTLLDNATIATATTLEKETTTGITLDLNEKTLTASVENAFKVAGASTKLTVTNGTVAIGVDNGFTAKEAATMTIAADAVITGVPLQINGGATLNVYGAIQTVDGLIAYTGTVNVYDGASIDISGSEVVGVYLFANNAVLNVYGGEITGEVAIYNYYGGATVNFQGGVISGLLQNCDALAGTLTDSCETFFSYAAFNPDPSPTWTRLADLCAEGYEPVKVGGEGEYKNYYQIALKTFDITFKVEGQDNIVSNDVAYGTAFADVKPADPTAPEFKSFKGWTPVVETIDGTKLEFTAEFTNNVYTITFAANGGEGTQDAIEYEVGGAVTAPECTFTAPTDGTFNCWSNATTFATYAVGATLPTECESYELVADWTITAPTPAYPEYIDPTDTELVGEYNTWKDKYGDDTGSVNEEAFLLNCAPEAVETAKKAFKFTEITVDAEGNVSFKVAEKTPAGDKLEGYNGYLVIKGKATLDAAEWHDKTTGDQFFQATLTTEKPTK